MTTCAVHTDPLLPKRAEDNIYLLTLVNITIVKRTFVKNNINTLYALYQFRSKHFDTNAHI